MNGRRGPNRRDVLRGIGGLGASVYVLSNGSLAQSVDSSGITILDGGEKMQIAAEFARTDAYRALQDRAKENGATVSRSRKDIKVGRRRTDDIAREVVQFPLRSVDDASYAAIVIGRHADSERLEFAWLDYYHEADDGVLTEVRRANYPVDDGGIETASTVSEKNIDIDDELIRNANRRVRENREYSVQGWGCFGCKQAVGTVCTTGCGAVGGFVCGFFGITVPIAGLSCLGFVSLVCTVADSYSGCGSAVAEEVCDDRLGVC